jgi:hypothetical protein
LLLLVVAQVVGVQAAAAVQVVLEPRLGLLYLLVRQLL